MRTLRSWYQLVSLLSLDVSAGAAVCGLFFSRMFRADVLPWGLCALGLTVWIIYTADHLLDARRVVTAASSQRHSFHQKHFKTILAAVLVATVIDLAMIMLIRKPVLKAGLGLIVLVAVYLVTQQRLKSFKELTAALLYSSGVALPALSLTPIPIGPGQIMLIAQFGITVFCNLLLFSLYDVHNDLRDQHNSFVTVMGEAVTRRLLYSLFTLNGVLAFILLISFSNGTGAILVNSTLVISAMNAILFLIFIFPDLFKTNGAYRILGDAIFLVPLFFLPK